MTIDIAACIKDGTLTQGENANRDIQTISTSSINLDYALGWRPIPAGRVVQISGKQGTGKTTLSLEIAKNAIEGRLVRRSRKAPPGMKDLKPEERKKKLDEEPFVVFFDMERALDSSLLDSIIPKSYLSHFLYATPVSSEDCTNMMIEFFKDYPGILVILDSIPALVTAQELEEGMGSQQMGRLGAMLSKFFRKSVNIIYRNRCHLVMLNQTRKNLGKYGPADILPGGEALKFYTSQHVHCSNIKKADRFENRRGEVIGHGLDIEVQKNKLGVPYRKESIPILYGKGIWKSRELLLLAKNLGIIELKGGGNYYYKGEKFERGIDNVLSKLEDNGSIAREIEDQILDLLK